jgi:thiosulfate/3-mercaptopyruvate sulfurtransferase
MRPPFLLGVLGLVAISPAAAQVAPAVRTNLLVSVAELAGRLDDPRLVLIQVDRHPAAYADGHIPGARSIPLRTILVERDGIPNELPPVAQLDSVLESVGVSNQSRIVIYGDPLAASRLFFTLDYLGLGEQVSLLDGGQPAWRAAGLPLATEAPSVLSGRLEPRVQSGILIEAAELAGRLGDSNVVVLDARPPAEYRGEVAGDGVTRAGHIPGAQGFFWRTALTSPEPAFLKDAAVLRKLLARAGLEPGREVITYCRTGVQASYLYFVARYLGYSPRMYDGSFLEWSHLTELPVER